MNIQRITRSNHCQTRKHIEGIVANKRINIIASLKDIAQLTKEYNNKLKDIVHAMDYVVFDLEPLLNTDSRDHHLDNEKISIIYSDALRKKL